MAELTASFQGAQLLQQPLNPEYGRAAVFSAIRNQIVDHEEPGNNFQRLYNNMQEENSETGYEDVDIESLLHPVPQFDVHFQRVRALKQEQKAFFEEIAHVLAEQARQQEISHLPAFISGVCGTG